MQIGDKFMDLSISSKIASMKVKHGRCLIAMSVLYASYSASREDMSRHVCRSEASLKMLAY